MYKRLATIGSSPLVALFLLIVCATSSSTPSQCCSRTLSD